MGYHGASCILLAVSGSMYILSAIQISNFFDLTSEETDFWSEQGFVFKKYEKIATGVSIVINLLVFTATNFYKLGNILKFDFLTNFQSLALVQAILFGVNAVLIVLQ